MSATLRAAVERLIKADDDVQGVLVVRRSIKDLQAASGEFRAAMENLRTALASPADGVPEHVLALIRRYHRMEITGGKLAELLCVNVAEVMFLAPLQGASSPGAPDAKEGTHE